MILVSVGSKPVAVIDTTVPGMPPDGDIVMVGTLDTTSNVNEAKSPAGMPVNMMMCAPNAAVAETANVAVTWPLEILQPGLVMMLGDGVSVMAQLVSAVLNPLPVISMIFVPPGAAGGLRTIVGVRAVTEKAAVAKSLLPPLFPESFTV